MAKSPTIPEAKIRQAIWMLKKGKSKKDCCLHLGISYNTKRLDTIIKDAELNEGGEGAFYIFLKKNKKF